MRRARRRNVTQFARQLPPDFQFGDASHDPLDPQLNFSTKLVCHCDRGYGAGDRVDSAVPVREAKEHQRRRARARGPAALPGLEAMLLPLGMHEVWSAAAASGEGVAEKLQAATADVNRAE